MHPPEEVPADFDELGLNPPEEPLPGGRFRRLGERRKMPFTPLPDVFLPRAVRYDQMFGAAGAEHGNPVFSCTPDSHGFATLANLRAEPSVVLNIQLLCHRPVPQIAVDAGKSCLPSNMT